MATVIAQQSSTLIDNLIARIVDAVHPLRIILFGSTSRGKIGPDSDVDVMVVMPDGTHRSNTVRYLYTQLTGFGFPVDIVVATPSLLDQHKDNMGLIYRSVLAEGKEIYVA
jgi:predicted nucleotidyltransferase